MTTSCVGLGLVAESERPKPEQAEWRFAHQTKELRNPFDLEDLFDRQHAED